MLALRLNPLSVVLIAIVTIGLNAANGQQLPSQRYQPVPNNPTTGAPPSVHVPPQAVRQLNGQLPFESQSGSDRSGSPTSYTFSDSPRVDVPLERNTIMQTSYQVDAKAQPDVPAILSQPSATANPAAPQSTAFPTAPQISAEAIPMVNEKTGPEKFATRMDQIRGDSPRIAPQDFVNGPSIREEMADLKRQVQQRRAAVQAGEASPPNEAITIPTGFAGAAATPVAHTTEIPTPNSSNPQAFGTSGFEGLRPQTNTETATTQQADVSARDFISQLQAKETAAPSSDQITAPGLATQASHSPATMRVAQLNNLVRDEQVRPVSAETVSDPEAAVNLPMPAISVETFGPRTVGINKPATYKIVVKNNGAITADRLLVGVNVPEWVDIENVNMTTGGKELTDGRDQARLVWNVDQVSGNNAQTMTITAVPRKAEMFDFGVEWTLVPRSGTAAIKVTQPKLEMTIQGPGDVLYGEVAVYHVTVRNPGTGTAENVTVMLPEALGGQRATIGDIEPGQDRNFEVELLARTAGDLNLIATAVAEGNLEVSADRKLTVRRANLSIGIEGPGLKYSGSVGQYLVTINNSGDAIAHDVVAALALPTGVKFLGGIESATLIEGGVRWQVGALDPGQTREYKVNCQLDTSGDLQLQVGAQSKGDLQSADACLTKVETVADLVLTVQDPKGPLPTGQDTNYEIRIRNRGSRAAKGVSLVMQFSEGIEPRQATGREYRIVPGQVLFDSIEQIEPGQELLFKVNAEALKSGTHIFRAQLTCEEADSREIAEGTTRFFGEDIVSPTQNTANSDSGFGQDSGNEFKR